MNDAQRAICFLRGHDDEQKSNQRALSRLLSNLDGPIDKDVRQTLGLMFNPDSLSAFKVERRLRGNPTGPVTSVVRDFKIGRAVEELLAKLRSTYGPKSTKTRDGLLKKARGDIAAQLNLSDSKVTKAHRLYTNAVGSGEAEAWASLAND